MVRLQTDEFRAPVRTLLNEVKGGTKKRLN